MADKEKYMIKIEENLVEVSPDVYYAYFRMERQERGQEEKKQRNAVLSYDALDTEKTTGADALPDLIVPSKFDPYLFNTTGIYLHGKEKLFEQWGYTVDDAKWLQTEMESQAREQYISGNY